MWATVPGHNNCFPPFTCLLHNNSIRPVIIQFHHVIITFKASNLPKCHLTKCCAHKNEEMMNYRHKGKPPNPQNSLCCKSCFLLHMLHLLIHSPFKTCSFRTFLCKRKESPIFQSKYGNLVNIVFQNSAL